MNIRQTTYNLIPSIWFTINRKGIYNIRLSVYSIEFIAKLIRIILYIALLQLRYIPRIIILKLPITTCTTDRCFRAVFSGYLTNFHVCCLTHFPKSWKLLCTSQTTNLSTSNWHLTVFTTSLFAIFLTRSSLVWLFCV